MQKKYSKQSQTATNVSSNQSDKQPQNTQFRLFKRHAASFTNKNGKNIQTEIQQAKPKDNTLLENWNLSNRNTQIKSYDIVNYQEMTQSLQIDEVKQHEIVRKQSDTRYNRSSFNKRKKIDCSSMNKIKDFSDQLANQNQKQNVYSQQGMNMLKNKFNDYQLTLRLNKQMQNGRRRQKNQSVKEVKIEDSQFFKKIVYNTAYKSIKGYCSVDQPKLYNQDNVIEKRSLNGREYISLLGVMDGHGEKGHLVSRFIKQKLPVEIEKQLQMNIFNDQQDNQNSLENKVIKSLRQAVENSYNELLQSDIRHQKSGSTICLLLIFGALIFAVNIGDSRAILIQNGEIIQLTQDQKPDIEEEKKRILANNGRIEAKKVQSRVYFQDRNEPGLNMTRSFGDSLSHCIGITYQPVISRYQISEEYSYIIVGSDGVFDVMEHEEIETCGHHFYSKNMSYQQVDRLANTAHNRWMDDFGHSDDVTVMAIYLKT